MNIRIESETWKIREPLVISRGALSVFEVMVVHIESGGFSGRAECFPTDRFGETHDSVRTQIERFARHIPEPLDHDSLGRHLSPGAARNAVDCALWDLEAARKHASVSDLLGFPSPDWFETVQTISLGEPESMAESAGRYSGFPLLKLKLGGDRDDVRVAKVREAAPQCRLVVDVNEGWTADHLREFLPAMRKSGVEMIEQPLPAGSDEVLGVIDHGVPICADEACRTTADLQRVAALYDMVNIKLDKCGGLSEGARLANKALQLGLGLMVGANMGTSLGVAATMAIAGKAALCDLDAAFWLTEDHAGGVRYCEGRVFPPAIGFWGDYRQAT